MKVWCIVVLLLISAVLSADDIHFYLIPEGIEAATENTDFIATDQVNITNALGGDKEKQQIDEEKQPTRMGNLSAEIETVINPKNTFVRIPLRYSWKQLSMDASIPYFFKREMNYASGKKSTSGIGDALLKTSYYFAGKSFRNELQFSVKFPTGDENKIVDGFLVPLGSGTTDYLIANHFTYNAQKFQLSGLISYRMNNDFRRIAEIIHPDNKTERIVYDITNGDTFIINSTIIYNITSRFSFLTGFTFTHNQEGTMDRTHTFSWNNDVEEYKNLSANQDFSFADVYPALCYHILKTDLVLAAKIPLLTERNEENNETSRKPEIFFRLTRKLF